MDSSKEINFNRSQSLIHMINANVTHSLWPRGGGKTEGGAGPRIIHLSETMPRSQCIFYSDTFERIEGLLIPNVMSFISNEMGIIEDQDFVVFKRPPENWTKPVVVPRKFERVVSFRSGFALCCASSYKDGSANGFNAQSGVIDETKFVRRDRIVSQLYKALRGQFRRWGHLPEYRSVWSFSDKYEGDIDWILRIRDKQDNRLIRAVFTKQIQLIEWKQELSLLEQTGASDSTIYRMRNKIIELEIKLNKIRREMIWVCDAEPFENIDILGEKFYRDSKRDCQSQQEYNVAVLNKDPDKVEHAYYPDFSEDNQYDDMNDIIVDKPLIISMDYNWRIVSLEVSQVGVLPGREQVSLNTIASVHAIEPNAGIPEAIKNFDELFANHRNRLVYYVYDSTAIARDPGRSSLHLLVIKELRLRKWRIVKIYIKDSLDQSVRFHKSKDYLINRGPLAVMVNKNRAWPLINSINRCGAITSSGKTRKDKRPETNLKVPAENAPHHTEAWDQTLCAVLERKMIRQEAARAPMLKIN